MAQGSKKITTKSAKDLFDTNATPKLGKYRSTLLNQINRWADGSKAENVGQVSELIKDFRERHPDGKLSDWKEYHKNLEGQNITVLQGNGKKKKRVQVEMAGIEQGVTDIRKKLDVVRESLNSLTDEDIRKWLENLTYEKTYCGLEAQNMILKQIAQKLGNGYSYTLGSMEDEQKGIDGYIVDSNNNNKYPLQIKSKSYKQTNTQEKFNCPIVYYELTKSGIKYNFSKRKHLKNFKQE